MEKCIAAIVFITSIFLFIIEGGIVLLNATNKCKIIFSATAPDNLVIIVYDFIRLVKPVKMEEVS